MRDQWQMWEGLFSPRTCDNTITLMKKLPTQTAVIGHGSGEFRDSPEIRRSKVSWVGREGRFIPLWDRILELYADANKNAFNFDLTELQKMQFTEYDADDEGHYSWHVDLDWGGEGDVQRKLSCVVQLSDPKTYRGGALQFGDGMRVPPNPKKLRQQGTVIIFPSYISHRVTPVTEGTRHSLVGWYAGPTFR